MCFLVVVLVPNGFVIIGQEDTDGVTFFGDNTLIGSERDDLLIDGSGRSDRWFRGW